MVQVRTIHLFSARTVPYDRSVDYGAKHSLQCGHRRYGRTHEVGLYPEWSVDHPLHFLGHSMVDILFDYVLTVLIAS